MSTNTRTAQILTIMHILAWIAFIGLMIEAGAILVSFIVNTMNEEVAGSLYKGLNWQNIKHFDFRHYVAAVSFLMALSGLKAYVLYLVIRALSRVNMANPFSAEVARILGKISYTLLEIAIIAVLQNIHAGWLSENGISQEKWPVDEYVFMAGIVFIIAQVFKRGVEIQSENDLTV